MTRSIIKARPILFSGAMVQALLAGRKTQTRRPVRNVDAGEHGFVGSFDERDGLPVIVFSDAPGDQVLSRVEAKCPYGKPGDLLYVRETWGIVNPNGELSGLPTFEYEGYREDYTGPFFKGRGARLQYAADGGEFQKAKGYRSAFKKRAQCVGGWRPSIHMPRWASRITLEITDVRVERLQDINQQDAIAEGIQPANDGVFYRDYMTPSPAPGVMAVFLPIFSYFSLWQSINGVESLAENPWVWVLEFKVHRQNVDEILAARAA